MYIVYTQNVLTFVFFASATLARTRIIINEMLTDLIRICETIFRCNQNVSETVINRP